MNKTITAFTICMALASTSVNAVVLYQNDFDSAVSPTYTTVFGSTETVGPVLGNTTHSLAFNSTGNTINNSSTFGYDQIQYGIDTPGSPYAGTNYQNFNVSFDIATDGLIGSTNHFVVLFDTPTVRNLIFNNDGTINVANFGSGSSGVIGNYANNESIHVDMNFDITSNQWDVLINNSLLYSAAMNANYLRSIRFSQGAVTSSNIDYNATTYLDNVVISAVPAPAAVWLFSSGLLALFGFTRKP